MEKKTIEEAAKEYGDNYYVSLCSHHNGLNQGYIAGAKNQSEQMYSGEEVNHYVDDVMGGCNLTIKEWKESKK